MFDIGWGELFLIGVVALIVVGPKDLPALFRTVGNFTGKARGMAREFQRSLEQAANEAGMSEMQKSLRSLDQSLNAATDSARKFATPADAHRRQGGGDEAGRATAPPAAAPEPAAAREPAPVRGACRRRGARGRAMKDGDKDIDDSTAPLIEHLVELRNRLINCLIAFCIAMVAAFTVAGPIFNFLAAPLAKLLVEHGQKPELIYTGLQQGFFTQVRISVFGGFVLAFPVISYQLWRFVAPGLYRQEKKAFLPFLIASPVLFMLGCAFAFYVLLPMVYNFFLGFQQFGSAPVDEPNQDVTIQFLGTINEYLSLTMKFMVAFGLCFQLPVALTLMGIAGLVIVEGAQPASAATRWC